MKIVFLGTGTSQGVPVIACSCAVCQSKDIHDKRLRSSVFIEHKGLQFVIDTGPDFRQQMLREKVKFLDFVLLTHEHKDHTAGLDDVRAFNHIQHKAMDIYANTITCNAITKEFYYAFSQNKYPGIPELNLHPVGDVPFTINELTVIPVKVMHRHLPILGFRIDNMAYITDANYIDPHELNKLKNLDILIINALRIESHYSHYNLDEAMRIAAYLQPKQTYFTHISHYISYEKYSKYLPQNMALAYDTLTINNI
jgi:phosphoribosyl 1,2-cyclic phosphate phosphodiesterase